MANMENKYKHMDYVQSAISRMASNSFHIKGWNVTIIAAIVALSFKESDWRIYACALALNFVFWFLDAYYLQQERRFRGVYNDVAGLSPDDSRITVREFEMPIQKYQCGKYCYFNVLFSRTIFPLYGIVIVGLVVTFALLF